MVYNSILITKNFDYNKGRFLSQVMVCRVLRAVRFLGNYSESAEVYVRFSVVGYTPVQGVRGAKICIDIPHAMYEIGSSCQPKQVVKLSVYAHSRLFSPFFYVSNVCRVVFFYDWTIN